MRNDSRHDTKLAAQLLRFSSLHSVGHFVAQGVGLGSTLVLVNFLAPEEYGRYALLVLYAAAISLVLTLATKPGTMRRVFGSAGDDDDAEDGSERDTQSSSPEKSLGNGLVMTALGGFLAIGVTVVLAGPLSNDLLSQSSAGAMGWAACAGAFLSFHGLISGVVWIERRPLTFAGFTIAQPCLMAAGSIPLVATGAGAEGAIAGIAAGSAILSLVGIYLVRRSFVWAFSLIEARTILRAGAPRIPVLLSFWTVGYVGVFLTSRYLSTADVGLFHFASRIAGIAAFVSASYKMALRPLLRSLAFAEVEADHGSAHARGTQLRYFILLGTGVLLAISMFADTIVRTAPPSYEEAASLVPLLAAGLLVPVLFQVLNKSVKFRGKRRLFPAGAVTGAVAYCAGSVLLLPAIGVEGVPLAMSAAFAAPVVVMGVASQVSQNPIAMPYRSSILTVLAAAGCWAIYQAISPDSLGWQLTLSFGLMAAWLGANLLTGAFPRSHRSLVWPTVMGAAQPHRARLSPRAALGALNSSQREALRQVVMAERGSDEVAPGSASAERALRVLQRGARAAGGLRHRAQAPDPQLIRFLFAQESFAAHDAVGRQLVRVGGIEPHELSQLEELVIDLRNCPDEAWSEPAKL